MDTQATDKPINFPRVPYELAILLKEVGFDYPTNEFYAPMLKKGDCEGRSGVRINYNGNEKLVSVPENVLVQQWLIDKHQIYINVSPQFESATPNHTRYCLTGWNVSIVSLRSGYSTAIQRLFDSIVSAQHEAFKAAIKFI